MVTNSTIAGLWRPSEKTWAGFYDIGLIFAGSFLIALSSKVRFLLPFSPVPITGQTFAVLMIGILLGSRRGSMAVLAYLIQGVAGMPVFTFGGGLAVMFGPTGGYLIGFIPAAYFTGRLAEKGWDRRIGTTILAMISGNIMIYTFGLIWLACLMGFSAKVLTVGVYPFIIGDLLKIALAAALLPSGWKLLESYKPR
jgi:biotin transport system substrate-specific component